MSGEVNAIIAQIAARGVRWAAGEITKLRAENAALKAMLAAEEWRPIEEAPKDEVVVLISNGKYVCDAWWSPEHEWVTDYESGPDENGEYPGHYEGAWIDGGLDGSEDSITYRPTHYRPLPQPPEVK